MTFANRIEAGRSLAWRLAHYADRNDVIVIPFVLEADLQSPEAGRKKTDTERGLRIDLSYGR